MTDRTSTSTSSSEEPPLPDTKSPAEIQLEASQASIANNVADEDDNSADDNSSLPKTPQESQDDNSSSENDTNTTATRPCEPPIPADLKATLKPTFRPDTHFDDKDIAAGDDDDEWSEETSVTYGYALASYTAPTESEGLDQLDFVKGQKLKLYNRHENGWWRADLHHNRGHIITGYVSVYFIDPFRYEKDHGVKLPTIEDLDEDDFKKRLCDSGGSEKKLSSRSNASTSSSAASSSSPARKLTNDNGKKADVNDNDNNNNSNNNDGDKNNNDDDDNDVQNDNTTKPKKKKSHCLLL